MEACTQPVVLAQSTCTTTTRLRNKVSRYLKKFLPNTMVPFKNIQKHSMVHSWSHKSLNGLRTVAESGDRNPIFSFWKKYISALCFLKGTSEETSLVIIMS
ncbi:hypothetical protein XENORESO_007258 [Xenotaenia resolanae]|uniref:Uncharacterized protein n=1 Tax=Xenotaenia resolanae TaxID=208358 RepID=A0ABV0W9T3_9TELE